LLATGLAKHTVVMTTFVNDSFRLCHLRIDSGGCPICQKQLQVFTR